ncbi:16826_t:CDS:2 [Dentiscutata erythropus]|uniref:16826_t:CDS:1 n=1 Tax=Dentiscutata erythropus TaxID=1348616 RepID=A0A9N9BRJ8_9GLOM|nr:16826_t:CDS:2 [Dentiscutata erythropus]
MSELVLHLDKWVVFDITVSSDRHSSVMLYVVHPFVKVLFASDLVSPIFWRRHLLVDEIVCGLQSIICWVAILIVDSSLDN